MFMTLAAFVVSASATPTPIDCSSGTVNISATGDYQLTSDASVSWDCIVVTGVNAAAPNYTDYVSIDCNGHTITITDRTKHALWAYTDGAGLFMWNSQANITACILSGSGTGAAPLTRNLVVFDHVGTGPNGWSSMLGIEYHYGYEVVTSSPYHASTWTQIYFGSIQAYNSDHGTYEHILCDNHWDSISVYQACVDLHESNYINVDYVNVIGYPRVQPALVGTDDGVVIIAAEDDTGNMDATTCVSHFDIGHVTTTNVFDLAVEPAGCVHDLHVHDVTASSTAGLSVGIFGCYYSCSFDGLEFDHSTYSTSSSADMRIFYLVGHNLTGSTLSNVNIYDNSGSHSGSGASIINAAGAPFTSLSFATVSNVTINNNNMDGALLDVQDTSTNFSGSSNGCSSVSPSGANVTC